jgi:anti-sigma B factor antagonist
MMEHEQGAVTVVTLVGEIDLETSPQLRTLLRAKAQLKEVRLLLDFSQVSYVDSSGMATLIEFYQTTKTTGGKLALAALTKRVQSALEIVRLHEILSIHVDLPTALHELAKA